MDRRSFLLSGVALALGASGGSGGSRRAPLALVTADTEGFVAVVDLGRRRVVQRVATLGGPRSIEARGRGPAIVGHAAEGAVTLLEDRPLRVRRTVWAALGSSAPAIAVVDVTDPRRPRLRRPVRAPFLVHDVAFSPSGARVG